MLFASLNAVCIFISTWRQQSSMAATHIYIDPNSRNTSLGWTWVRWGWFDLIQAQYFVWPNIFRPAGIWWSWKLKVRFSFPKCYIILWCIGAHRASILQFWPLKHRQIYPFFRLGGLEVVHYSKSSHPWPIKSSNETNV